MEHRTKNGTILLIAEMEDEHLKNTIDLIIKNISSYYNLLQGKEDYNINYIVAGRRNFTKKELENFIKNSTERLTFYIFEAQIRGIDYSDKLQELFQRKGKLENILLLEKIKDENNDEISIEDIPF